MLFNGLTIMQKEAQCMMLPGGCEAIAIRAVVN